MTAEDGVVVENYMYSSVLGKAVEEQRRLDQKARFHPMRPGISLMRDDGGGVYVTFPTLCGMPVFFSVRLARRHPIHVGWGRCFARQQPWWGYFGMWRFGS